MSLYWAAPSGQQSDTAVKNTITLGSLFLKPLKCGHQIAHWLLVLDVMWCVFWNCCLLAVRTQDSRLRLTWIWQTRLSARRGRRDQRRPCFILITQAACNFQNWSQILAVKAPHSLAPCYVVELWRLCECSHSLRSPGRGPQAAPERPGVTAPHLSGPRGSEWPAWGEQPAEWMSPLESPLKMQPYLISFLLVLFFLHNPIQQT